MMQNKRTLHCIFCESCDSGDLMKIQACLNLGVNINGEEGDCNCGSDCYDWHHALFFVASSNGLEVLDYLLTLNIDVNVLLCGLNNDNWGATASILMVACKYNNPDVVRRLLQVPNINFDYQDEYGWTVLHWAAKYSAVLIVWLSFGITWKVATLKG